MDKNKKKTLTISSSLKKKIDTSSISTAGKKSFSVDNKKKTFRGSKTFNRGVNSQLADTNQEIKRIKQANVQSGEVSSGGMDDKPPGEIDEDVIKQLKREYGKLSFILDSKSLC